MSFRKYFYVMVICLLIFCVGCTNQILLHEALPEEEFPPDISGFVEVNGEQTEMRQGGFKWERGDQVVMTDAASPLQIAKTFEAIVLPPQSELTIHLEGNSGIELYVWEDEHRGNKIPVREGKFTAPEAPGHYVFEAVATWSKWGKANARGEVSYTFVVEVE
ncbi:hypothetical protein [Caldalkalibacillus mannanilyticus]|uniref:hypothetical protein n=1 Tax=Caldalkalibacillus mannanilyticus TaxID=1418 RepID=UPI00046A32F4|nr:hypothetical protein [Caldalkalibacillus mannanilyticus]